MWTRFGRCAVTCARLSKTSSTKRARTASCTSRGTLLEALWPRSPRLACLMLTTWTSPGYIPSAAPGETTENEQNGRVRRVCVTTVSLLLSQVAPKRANRLDIFQTPSGGALDRLSTRTLYHELRVMKVGCGRFFPSLFALQHNPKRACLLSGKSLSQCKVTGATIGENLFMTSSAHALPSTA